MPATTKPRPDPRAAGAASNRIERRGSESREVLPAAPSPHAHPWDGLIVGPEIALAHAAATAIAHGEPTGLSPLVVHGPAGVGKSRLLAGLVTERLLRRPESAIAQLDAETFAAACAEAATARHGGWAELRARFRQVDLLVLDDLHTLERAPLAIVELVHLLDALEATGAAVAVAARSAPGQWMNLPARLVSRLAGGLSARIEPPGLETRRRYVLDQARARGMTLPADAVETLAAATDSYRTLDGLLARLVLDARLSRRPIDEERTAAALAEPGAVAPPVPIGEVIKAVAARFKVHPRDLRSSSRRSSLIIPRHLAIYLARRHTGLSFAAIGRHFGRRDPATIRHACAMAAERIRNDPSLAAVAEALAVSWRWVETPRP